MTTTTNQTFGLANKEMKNINNYLKRNKKPIQKPVKQKTYK